jgi:hypothetical protein
MRRWMVLAVLAVPALMAGCMHSPREKFTEMLVNEQTRQAGWVGLISYPTAGFSPDQIRRAREGSFRPVKVHVIPRPLRGPLYLVEAEGYSDAPAAPRTDPPRLLGSLESTPELIGPDVLMWNKDDTFVRYVDLREARAALIDLTGDKVPELVLWSRYAEIGPDPEHSKVAVFDLNADLRQPKRPLLAVVVLHGKLPAGHQIVWSPLEAGRFGIVLYDVTGTSPGGAQSARVAVFEWQRRDGKFSGPTGGGGLVWSRVD